jgi:hypothetical protein
MKALPTSDVPFHRCHMLIISPRNNTYGDELTGLFSLAEQLIDI